MFDINRFVDFAHERLMLDEHMAEAYLSVSSVHRRAKTSVGISGVGQLKRN